MHSIWQGDSANPLLTPETLKYMHRQSMSFITLLMRKTSKCFVLRNGCEFHLPQEIHILQLLQISSDCSSRFSLVTWDERGRPNKVRYFFKGAAKNMWITSCENCDLDCTLKNERKDRAIFCCPFLPHKCWCDWKSFQDSSPVSQYAKWTSRQTAPQMLHVADWACLQRKLQLQRELNAPWGLPSHLRLPCKKTQVKAQSKSESQMS